MIASSGQCIERVKNYATDELEQKTYWKTILLTPYDATIRHYLVEDEVYKELVGYGLELLGIDEIVDPEENGNYREWVDDDGFKRNGIFRWLYKADMRSGYWTLEICHTLALLPDDIMLYASIIQSKPKKTEGKQIVSDEDHAGESDADEEKEVTGNDDIDYPIDEDPDDVSDEEEESDIEAFFDSIDNGV